MTAPGNTDDVFEPASATDTARASAEFEGTNVCRAGSLSSLLQESTEAMSELSTELRSLGFSDTVVERAGRNWREFDPFDGETVFALSPDEDLDEIRVRRWIELNQTADPRRAASFLVAMLGSGLERESTAAAAALWRGLDLQDRQWPPPGPPRWRMLDRIAFDLDDVLPDVPWGPWFWWQEQDPSVIDDESPSDAIAWNADRWRENYLRSMFRLRGDRYLDSFVVSVLVRGRLEAAMRSPDSITRSLALAALQPVDAGDGFVANPPTPQPTPAGALVVSTMIHGTWGWKGDWWRPGGAFHQFILGNHRPNLFSRGAKFSWSGAYSDKQRSLAASDFADWACDVAPHGIQTVFGHSYGGEIASRAVNAGSCIHELVLLSTPVTQHVEMASRTAPRVVDVRLRFDPVLAIAGARQRIPKNGNVTEVLLRRWRLDHGASHEEKIWRDEDVAVRGQL